MDLCGSLWIFVDIDGDICGQLEDTYAWIFVDLCGSLWIFVDLCGYSIQSYLHAGRPKEIGSKNCKISPSINFYGNLNNLYVFKGN